MRQGQHDIYTSAPLRRLLDAQMCVLTPELQHCFGKHGLLIDAGCYGMPPALPLLACCTRLQAQHGAFGGDLRAAADEPLPFVDDAFELVVLRHVIEQATAPSASLAEAIRVLAPGGMLVLTGLHPLSAWLPWFCWHARGGVARPLLPLRLRHELQQAGLEIERQQRVGGAWPGAVTTGNEALPILGGGYVLIARKRRRMVAPLRLKPVRVPANGRLSPGTRRSSAW